MKPLSHCVTGEEFTGEQIKALLQQALALKKLGKENVFQNKLTGRHLALLFDKPSLRTRFSFTVAMRQLGGDVVESISDTRKAETPEDQARVLSGYCDAIMIRTHEDEAVKRMSKYASVPVINGLSNLHHPCQILADLLTIAERFGHLSDITLAYIGDGNNILHSLLLMAPLVGVNIHYCCPKLREPNAEIVQQAQALINNKTGQIKSFATPAAAVAGANVVYTDVWTSMGFENSSAEHLFSGFQVNEMLMQQAADNAVFMHCLPMERGKEVSETLPDQPCSVIFQQSENRLHVQKALLLYLLNN